MHAYRNPEHERLAKRILERECPEIPISVSSEVAPEIREYQRASTTCANAYVQPRIAHYLARLQDGLRVMRLPGKLYIMLSNGGITTVRAAREFPIQLIESGPAAGAMAAGYYGLLTNTSSPISFAMGATTAKMRLVDRGWVERAIEEHVARPLGLDMAAAAVGIHDVVNENMAAATRMHAAEKGQDPRRFALIAFGGAGPVHAYGLARLLKVRRIICPFGAGVTSALGMLVAAPSTHLVRSYVSRLANIHWTHLNGLFAELEGDAPAPLVEAGADPAELTLRRTADMRYAGQGFEIPVPLADGPLGPGSLDDLKERFLATYAQLFERRITDMPIEAISWRLAATAPVPTVA